MKYEIRIQSLMAKPRMTRQDKWKKRPATTAYWAFKDELTLLCNQVGYCLDKRLYAVFCIEMPQSWSEKKKKLMDGTRHEPRPDCDNYIKGISDCLKSEGDSMITPMCGHKIWARESSIIFFDTLTEWYEHVASLSHDV